ncbi:hypothetical protein FACS189418_2680 [Clostridia bacterium]|nr:hypothetical protein FACS189418_2680 [Clostridia bacterium]
MIQEKINFNDQENKYTKISFVLVLFCLLVQLLVFNRIGLIAVSYLLSSLLFHSIWLFLLLYALPKAIFYLLKQDKHHIQSITLSLRAIFALSFSFAVMISIICWNSSYFISHLVWQRPLAIFAVKMFLCMLAPLAIIAACKGFFQAFHLHFLISIGKSLFCVFFLLSEFLLLYHFQKEGEIANIVYHSDGFLPAFLAMAYILALGLSSLVVSIVYLFFLFLFQKKLQSVTLEENLLEEPVLKPQESFGEKFFTLGKITLSLWMPYIAYFLVFILNDLVLSFGLITAPTSLMNIWGEYALKCLTIWFIPVWAILSFSQHSLLPLHKKSRKFSRFFAPEKSRAILRVTLNICLPIMILVFVFGQQIFSVWLPEIFPKSSILPIPINYIGAILLLPLILSLTSAELLVATRYSGALIRHNFYTLSLHSVVLIIGFLFRLNIYSLFIAQASFFLSNAIINYAFFTSTVGKIPDLKQNILYPVFANGIFFLLVFVLFQLFSLWIKSLVGVFCLTLFPSMVIYIFLLLYFQLIPEEDLSYWISEKSVLHINHFFDKLKSRPH